ncbi:hypothetical protein BEN76_12045 [Acinetobacter soli]|uniref:Uncharacterized protein n=1 Tax=Acinetobacter soli TaxID=487316 RepID=A0A1P8EKG1_9GAMM|nr:hypothetical protein BEN76_12045 [Acinetobacter soli]
MMCSTRPIQICSQMRTKSHCIKTHKIAQYAQQHPTRLCKQLYPQIVGLLFSAIRKYNNQSTYKQLPQCAGNTV